MDTPEETMILRRLPGEIWIIILHKVRFSDKNQQYMTNCTSSLDET